MIDDKANSPKQKASSVNETTDMKLDQKQLNDVAGGRAVSGLKEGDVIYEIGSKGIGSFPKNKAEGKLTN